jgi:hypothetical protein
MPSVRIRIISSSPLFLFGTILFFYGATFHAVRIMDKDNMIMITKSESVMIKQISDTCPIKPG